MVEESFSFFADAANHVFSGALTHTEAAPFPVGSVPVEMLHSVDSFIPIDAIADVTSLEAIPEPPFRAEEIHGAFIATDEARVEYLETLYDTYLPNEKEKIDTLLLSIKDMSGPEVDQLREKLIVLRAKIDYMQSEIGHLLTKNQDDPLATYALNDKVKEFHERLVDAVSEAAGTGRPTLLSLVSPAHASEMSPGTAEAFFTSGKASAESTRRGSGIEFLSMLFPFLSKK